MCANMRTKKSIHARCNLGMDACYIAQLPIEGVISLFHLHAHVVHDEGKNVGRLFQAL